MTKNENNRKNGIDILKALCAFLVVLIHTDFPGKIGYYVIAISRIAVPVFYMITGFFYVKSESDNSQLSSIKKIFFLTISSTILYLIIEIILGKISGMSIVSFLNEKTGKEQIITWLIFNNTPFGGHLWYLYALLYCLIFFYFLKKYMSQYADTILTVLTPLLLCIDLILGKYSKLLLNREFPYYIVRNFMFVAIPYFYIGYYIRKHYDKISKINNYSFLEMFFIIVLVLTTCLEKYLSISLGFNNGREHYISSTFLSVIVFTIFTDDHWNTKNVILSKIGRRYSLFIYIIHPILIDLFNIFMLFLPKSTQNILRYFEVFLIYLLAIIVSIAISKCSSKFKIISKNHP